MEDFPSRRPDKRDLVFADDPYQLVAHPAVVEVADAFTDALTIYHQIHPNRSASTHLVLVRDPIPFMGEVCGEYQPRARCSAPGGEARILANTSSPLQSCANGMSVGSITSG